MFFKLRNFNGIPCLQVLPKIPVSSRNLDLLRDLI